MVSSRPIPQTRPPAGRAGPDAWPEPTCLGTAMPHRLAREEIMKRLAAAALSTFALLALPAPVAAAAAPTKPAGNYRGKVTSNALHGALKGTWTLTFRNGTLVFSKGGKRQGQDKYSVKDGKVHLKPAGPCTGTGVYRYTIAARKLSFSRLNDRCVSRRTILSASFTEAT